MKYNQLTTEQFIERARSIHGDKYDYSETVYTTRDKKVNIKCRKHGVFSQLAGNHINPKIKIGCPYCAGKKVYKGENDLQSQFPNIAKYFDEYKNGVKADEVFAHSNKKYWWKCDKGHSFEMSPLNRVLREKSCPYCSGQRILSGFNDLQTIYPDIASEWDYGKNEGSPSGYTYGSGYKAWWVCKDCGESYQSPINVHIRGHKCPYCTGAKVLVGKTDLQTLFPDIAREYAKDNDIPVNEISASTHKKVKWICPNCHEEYWASPHHRTSKDRTECPFCKKPSKGERRIKNILDKYGIEYKQQEWFNDLYGDKGKPLRFDFTLYANNEWIGSIEYNGQQHYQPVDIFGGEAVFRRQVEYDKRKLFYCLSHGVPILQVTYDRPKRFMSVEDEVIRFLENLNLIRKENVS